MKNNLPDSLKQQIDALDQRIAILEKMPFRVPVVTSDPNPLQNGFVWIRSDLNQLCYYQGSTLRRI